MTYGKRRYPLTPVATTESGFALSKILTQVIQREEPSLDVILSDVNAWMVSVHDGKLDKPRLAIEDITDACWIVNPARMEDMGIDVMHAFYNAVRGNASARDEAFIEKLPKKHADAIKEALTRAPVDYINPQGLPSQAISLTQLTVLFHVGRLGVRQPNTADIFLNPIPIAAVATARYDVNKYYHSPRGRQARLTGWHWGKAEGCAPLKSWRSINTEKYAPVAA